MIVRAGALLSFSLGVALSGACSDSVHIGEGGSGASGASQAETGAGGGDPVCEGKNCGDACSSTSDPGSQHICDAFGKCSPALDVTCSPCPEATPGEGNACDTIGLVCEFDPGPVLNCRRRSTCAASGWHNQSTDCSSSPSQDPSCPSSKPAGSCDSASDPAICSYGDDFCGCPACAGSGCGDSWICAAPPKAPCPPVAPLLGQPCQPEGSVCNYGACGLSFQGERRCDQGLWTEVSAGCTQ